MPVNDHNEHGVLLHRVFHDDVLKLIGSVDLHVVLNHRLVVVLVARDAQEIFFLNIPHTDFIHFD